jgi:hypothetical protein
MGEGDRKLMNDRRPEWKVWFTFYGDMKNEAQAMESIDWK